MKNKYSIIIPACNEGRTIGELLQTLVKHYPDAEVIVVNDGSEDDTARIAASAGAQVISSPYSMGNGAAVKAGARAAGGDIFIFMDADGQHQAQEIDKLIKVMDEGYDMVIGARSIKSHASMTRYLANVFYNWFASWVSGHKVQDLTSGFRLIRADKFREFLYLLPNGFSYPTTITMAMFRAGYQIAYVPVDVGIRKGRSHIRPLVDGIRFLLIIFKVGTLYAPLKIFFPVSAFIFLGGLSYYAYTFITQNRFTNMSLLLFMTAIIIFLIGLVSEQLTVLLYSSSRHQGSGKWKSER